MQTLQDNDTHYFEKKNSETQSKFQCQLFNVSAFIKTVPNVTVLHRELLVITVSKQLPLQKGGWALFPQYSYVVQMPKLPAGLMQASTAKVYLTIVKVCVQTRNIPFITLFPISTEARSITQRSCSYWKHHCITPCFLNIFSANKQSQKFTLRNQA